MAQHDSGVLADSLDKSSAARIYDYLLGGSHNYAIDRQFADQQLALDPEIRTLALTNRAYLRRAVQFALAEGITQFVDIGSGLPTGNNVHEIAEEQAPGQAHVVYIDNDPICRAHSEILLGTTADPARHGAICADYRDAEQLWEQVLDTGLIDTGKPLALLTVSLLHFIDDPAPALAFYQSQVPAGSLLAFIT